MKILKEDLRRLEKVTIEVVSDLINASNAVEAHLAIRKLILCCNRWRLPHMPTPIRQRLRRAIAKAEQRFPELRDSKARDNSAPVSALTTEQLASHVACTMGVVDSLCFQVNRITSITDQLAERIRVLEARLKATRSKS